MVADKVEMMFDLEKRQDGDWKKNGMAETEAEADQE